MFCFKKEFAFFSFLLLLLIFLLMKTTILASANGSARFGSFRSLKSAPMESTNGGCKGNKDDGDAAFDDDKRKIHTGPNPLHNK